MPLRDASSSSPGGVGWSESASCAAGCGSHAGRRRPHGTAPEAARPPAREAGRRRAPAAGRPLRLGEAEWKPAAARPAEQAAVAAVTPSDAERTAPGAGADRWRSEGRARGQAPVRAQHPECLQEAGTPAPTIFLFAPTPTGRLRAPQSLSNSPSRRCCSQLTTAFLCVCRTPRARSHTPARRSWPGLTRVAQNHRNRKPR